MPWYDAIKQLAQAVDGEYDRRIRSASNVKAYHPEGGSHGHNALGHDEHVATEEEGGGAGTVGALQGAAGPQDTADPAAAELAQH